jgi:putative tricarboxylic transport membrane protein
VWHDLLSGFVSNLEPTTLLLILIGTVAGTVMGALPGVSSISAIALILPFTFGLEPAQGLVLLAAVYMSSEFGGAIPAILLGTPGTSGAACTMLDGYPMTKKGQAQEALYLQLFAGTVGGLLGALLLLFLTPPLARVSQLLGPPELFWIAVAGLALVATLVGRNILGGLIGVALGVLLTTPGQDPSTGQLRFTFGSPDLVGGLPLVPMLLGLFAVASILTMLEQRDGAVAPLHRKPGVIREVLGRMWGMKKVLTWTSFVGALVGLVPGPGSSASAFAAYSEAKRLSKNREEFGKGAWEGVAAPEAANNAVIGGSLVPLLGIGIPGSAAAAIMFGALTVHGIIAGPRLFVEQADVAYTFIAGLFFTVAAMLLFGLATVRFSSLLVRAPVRFVIPAVLSVTLVGVFGLRNNLFDVVVVVAVGVGGFLLEKVGIRWIPLALGLVLGHVLETRLQQSLIIAPTRGGNLFTYWMTRPLTILLILVVVFLLVSGFRQIVKSKDAPVETLDDDEVWADRVGQELPGAETPTGGEPDGGTPVGARPLTGKQAEGASAGGASVAILEPPPPPEDGRRWVNLRVSNVVVSVVLIGLAVWVLLEMGSWVPRARYMPAVVCALILVLAVVLLVVNLLPRYGREREKVYPFAGVPWRLWVAVTAGLVVVAFTVRGGGLLEMLFLWNLAITYLLCRSVHSRRRAAVEAVAYSIGITAFLYLGFDVLLGVAIPGGAVF